MNDFCTPSNPLKNLRTLPLNDLADEQAPLKLLSPIICEFFWNVPLVPSKCNTARVPNCEILAILPNAVVSVIVTAPIVVYTDGNRVPTGTFAN